MSNDDYTDTEMATYRIRKRRVFYDITAPVGAGIGDTLLVLPVFEPQAPINALRPGEPGVFEAVAEPGVGNRRAMGWLLAWREIDWEWAVARVEAHGFGAEFDHTLPTRYYDADTDTHIFVDGARRTYVDKAGNVTGGHGRPWHAEDPPHMAHI